MFIYPFSGNVFLLRILTFEKQITTSNHHYFLNSADQEKTVLRTDGDPPNRTWNGKFHGYITSGLMGDQPLLLTDLEQNSGAEPTQFATADRKNEPSCRGYQTGAETEKLYE